MNNDLYEVSHNEFKGFIEQIKPECFIYKEIGYSSDCNEEREIKILSTDESRHFASIITKYAKDEIETHFYVYEMPKDEERRAAKRIRQITLETPEEVKLFFQALNNIQKGEKNDRNLS